MHRPSIAEILADPVVRSAFEASWAESLPDDSILRHEEGGWLLFDKVKEVVIVRRGPPGTRNSYTFIRPDIAEPIEILAMFHTHPTPPTEGGLPDPTEDDRSIARDWRIPSIVISELDIFVIDRDGNVSLGGQR